MERWSLNENNLKAGRARKPHTNRPRKPDDTMRPDLPREVCMQVRKQQLELDMEQQTGFK